MVLTAVQHSGMALGSALGKDASQADIVPSIRPPDSFKDDREIVLAVGRMGFEHCVSPL